MPLVQPVPLVEVDDLGAVHFIAVGGAGMSGIAAMFAERGVQVSGSDQADSEVLADLAATGVRTFVGHHAEQLGEAETVVVSTAVRESNPELIEARRRGLRIWHRSAALGALMLHRRGIAVTGTHGKTTTSAMIATILRQLNTDPSYVVGSPLTQDGRNHRLGQGPAFVVEADESDGSFRQYPAEVVVITNVEADHLDNWGTPEAYAEGFFAMACADSVQTVVISADDLGAQALLPRIRAAGKRVVTFGEAREADVRLASVELHGRTARAQIITEDDMGAVELAVPGRYNVHNAAAAYAAVRALGLDGEATREALGSFVGTHRRFQPVGESAGVHVFDDYAHHPTEVSATLAAARDAAGLGRLVACFQPHLFSRTRDFAEQFGDALALADQIVVLDIYPAREDPIPGVTGELVADAARAAAGVDHVHYAASINDAVDTLAELAIPGDLIITIGAGDVTKLGPLLVERLSTTEGS